MSEGGTDKNQIERRAFLKRAAVVAGSAPVILTVLANSAAASHAGDDCISVGSQCGVYNSTTAVCDESPAGSGSTGECCTGNTCLPTTTVNGLPCTCGVE